MSIMNRRNAVLGWATWAVFKRALNRKAKAEAEAAAEQTKRSFRRRKEQVVEAAPEPEKKRSKRRLLGLLSATAVGVGIWASTRRKGGPPVE